MRIHKGDNIKVVAGKDRGKIGTVARALPGQESVVVEGVNMRKHHVRARRSGQKGEIVQFAAPLHVSNVRLVCGACGKATRIGYRVEGTVKNRTCKKCSATV